LEQLSKRANKSIGAITTNQLDQFNKSLLVHKEVESAGAQRKRKADDLIFSSL